MLIAMLSFAIHVTILLLSFDKPSYRLLIKDRQKQHLLLGYTTFLTFLWSFEASVIPSLPIHFLGITACGLILGHHLALLAGTFAFFILNIFTFQSINIFCIELLSQVGLPVFISYLIYVVAYHKLPKHFFVYTFVCGFFAGAVAIFTSMLSYAGLLWLQNLFTWSQLVDNYLIVVPLLLFPEAMLNGMLISVAVIYLPHWVRCFHDEDYLDK